MRIFGVINVKYIPVKLYLKRLVIVLLLCATIIALIEGYISYVRPALLATDKENSTDVAPILQPGIPDYDAVTPSDKDTKSIGWTRISPPDSDPVYAFTDKIDNVPIIISQQPLPLDLQDDTDKAVANLAKDFNANQKLSVNDTTVYIGTSSAGPQSVIFTTKGLLILIKSNTIIKNASWHDYIASLQ
jgi:hypothetical protein